MNNSKCRKRRLSLYCNKGLSALLHEINSKYKYDFYCLSYLHPFRTENKLKSYENVCKNKDIFGIAMPSQQDIILQFNQYMKPDKMPYIFYTDLQSQIKKIHECANNPEKPLQLK